MTHYTKTKGAQITALIILIIILLGLCPKTFAERLPKEANHFHRCQSIKNGIRCNKECLEGEKYCWDDIQLESI